MISPGSSNNDGIRIGKRRRSHKRGGHRPPVTRKPVIFAILGRPQIRYARHQDVNCRLWWYRFYRYLHSTPPDESFGVSSRPVMSKSNICGTSSFITFMAASQTRASKPAAAIEPRICRHFWSASSSLRGRALEPLTRINWPVHNITYILNPDYFLHKCLHMLFSLKLLR